MGFQQPGGIITNPEFNNGIEGWIGVGNTKLASAWSLSGNSYAEVSNILTAGSHDISQFFDMNKDDFYVVSGVQALALVPYDYSYTLGCMPEAAAPQYGGGIIINPEFNYGIEGWVGVGNAKLASAWSLSGNSYAEVSNILTAGSDDISHSFYLNKDDFYVVSAWFQASGGGTIDVEAKLVASNGNRTAAKSGCWTMLMGGFSGNVTELVELRFQATECNPGMENYTKPDAMLDFCKSNNITARGHNLLWDDEKFHPGWVLKLRCEDRRRAAIKHVETVVKRYRGDFTHRHVINENLHRKLCSHPAVEGIIVWSAMNSENTCCSMCLTDKDYKNLPSGDIVDKFMAEFITVANTKGDTDIDGVFEALLFYGEYEVTLPDGATRSSIFRLVPGDEDAIFRFKI